MKVSSSLKSTPAYRTETLNSSCIYLIVLCQVHSEHGPSPQTHLQRYTCTCSERELADLSHELLASSVQPHTSLASQTLSLSRERESSKRDSQPTNHVQRLISRRFGYLECKGRVCALFRIFNVDNVAEAPTCLLFSSEPTTRHAVLSRGGGKKCSITV